ncbi:hypothetical protein ACIPWE_38805 [Streptomyces sp. NPDC090073]|uniref:hypothetical protein n=1 Tax=Streptomyces sp. NPDC090073 TaxID=3365936 RepID=UPI00381DA503
MAVEPIPVQPRQDPGAADIQSLVRMGEADPPPVPAPATDPFLQPDWPPDDQPA